MIIEGVSDGTLLLCLIIILTIVIAGRDIIPFLFNKIGIPDLVGWIILGFILISLTIEDINIGELLQISPHANDPIKPTKIFFYKFLIQPLSNVGITLLMFSVGLKISIKDMTSVGKTAFITAFFGVVIPLIFGLAFARPLSCENINCALFLAASMVATSVGITAYVIQHLHLIHTKEAKIIIGAAIIDDVLGVIVLAVVSWIASGEAYSIDKIFPLAVVSIITIALSTHFIIPWIQKNIRKNSIKLIPFIFSISFCAILAFSAEMLHLTSIIGAFTAGVILSKHAETWELNKKIEPLAKCLLPFFFISTGLHINAIDSDILHKAAIITVLAVAGKYLGCSMAAKRIDKSMSAESARIIGVGMIPRGEVGIIVANAGSGTMPTELHAAVIIMSAMTAMIAPPLLSILLKRKYGNNTNLKK